jgi:rRNA-processing protein EBP2
MNFYNHAVMAVKAGQAQLEALGVPLHRPHDYFCEHVKSDSHMDRVRNYSSLCL